MSRGSRIVSIGPESAPAVTAESGAAEAEPLELSTENEWAEDQEDEAPQRSFAWLAPTAAFLLIAGWTGVFVWNKAAEMLAPATLERWLGWISAWSMPVLLIAVAWLLAMRHSRREASRFGDVARLLGTQSVLLSERLVKMNQELSLAREFIAAQSRDLEALGRVATDRLSTNADRLQALIMENSAQLEGIGTVSAAALDNMERLRGQLPVIASSAKDVTNNIANAGRTAHGQLQEMVTGFNRLNEFGQASERQVEALRRKVDEALEEFGTQAAHFETLAETRFAALAERGEAFRAQLEGHEVEALAAMRTRASALGEELEQTRQLLDGHEAESLTSLRARLGAVRDESTAIARNLRDAESNTLANWRSQLNRMEEDMRAVFAALEQADGKALETARTRLDAFVEEAQRHEATIAERQEQFAAEMDRRRNEALEQEAAALSQFSERLQALDGEIATRRERHQQQSAALAAQGEQITARFAAFETQLAAIAAHGGEAQAKLGTSLEDLSARLAKGRDALAETDREIAALTDSSVRLLELIQASAQHSSQELPAALGSGEERLGMVETRIFAMRDAVNEATESSDKLSAYVLAAGDAVRSAIGELGDLHDKIDARSQIHAGSIADIRASLAEAASESDLLAERAQKALAEAIGQLSTAAREAVNELEEQGAVTVSELARRLSEESREAVDRAMHNRASEIAGQIEQATAHAAGIGREAALQLRDQLAKVNELAGNLERRVARAREQAEEQVDNDFARRVALITEALNSHAIDISRALDSEVSDTAWASYLRGDRGIFTRRAVSLLDSGEARSVAQLYEGDRQFMEHVNRYIHDFEAMLRQLLSTRDGHALGVTLLSSDMGKLYVALAQAIERLRS